MFLFSSTKYTPHFKKIRASSPGSCFFQQAPTRFSIPFKKKCTVTPLKTKMISIWKYSFIHGGFSIVILVFGWGSCQCLTPAKSQGIEDLLIRDLKRIWKKTNQKSSWPCFWCWVSKTSDGNDLCWVSQTYCFLLSFVILQKFLSHRWCKNIYSRGYINKSL